MPWRVPGSRLGGLRWIRGNPARGVSQRRGVKRGACLQRKRRVTYQQLAQRAMDDCSDIKPQVLVHLLDRSRFPLAQHCIPMVLDLFDVMIHVLDEKNLVIERFFIFRVTDTLAHDPMPCRHRRVVLRNDLQTLEHCLVDPLICVVNRGAHVELLGAL